MPDIFEYLNYQAFMRDYYEARKRQNSFFSYRFMGKVLGMDPGFLVKVIQGKILLPERAIPAVAKLCKLGEKEAEYFAALVRYGRAKRPEDIKARFDRLIALRGLESRPLEPSQYDYYKKWYHSAIRALLTFWDFRGDYAALAARVHPRISAAEARASVELLERTGIIRRNAAGRYEVLGPPITTGERWQSTAIRNYQQESIELALQSLVKDPKAVRDISTVTVAVRFSDLEEIRARIQELRQSLMHLPGDSSEPDCVYQINFQAFPLTEAQMPDGTDAMLSAGLPDEHSEEHPQIARRAERKSASRAGRAAEARGEPAGARRRASGASGRAAETAKGGTVPGADGNSAHSSGGEE
jgi:uncharacterized protein (TIGR02147 family)